MIKKRMEAEFERQKKIRRRLAMVYMVFALAILAVTLIIYFKMVAPKPTYGNSSITIIVEYSNVSHEYIVNTDQANLMDVLMDMNESHSLKCVEDGGFITSFLGVDANPESQYYAIYFIKNDSLTREYATTGAKDTAVQDGYTYIFALTDFTTNELGIGALPRSTLAIITIMVIAFAVPPILFISYIFISRHFFVAKEIMSSGTKKEDDRDINQ